MFKKLIFLLLLLFPLGCFLPTLPQAAMPSDWRPQLKVRAGIPPFSVIAKIMEANHQALQGIRPGAVASAPHLVWLADADFRIRTEMVWAQQPGGIFMVSNLANQVEQAAAALDYAILHLRAPVLLITGNSDSRAIKLFKQGSNQPSEAIARELDRLHPALPSNLPPTPLPIAARRGEKAQGVDGDDPGLGADQDAGTLFLRQVESNVDYQVAQALARYRDRVAAHRLVVVGGIIDLANKRGGGAGRLYLININGETDPAKILASPHLVRVAPNLRGFIGRR